MKEVGITPSRESLQVELSVGLRMLLVSPMAKVSMTTEAKIILLHYKYRFPGTFHIHILRLENRVTSSLVEYLAVYEESLRAGLWFPPTILL